MDIKGTKGLQLRVQLRVVVKIIGRAVGCGTEPTGSDEDKGVPLGGACGFSGAVCGLSTCANLGRGGHGLYTALVRLMWVC